MDASATSDVALDSLVADAFAVAADPNLPSSWPWLLDDEKNRFAHELPPPSVEPCLDPVELTRRMRAGANDTFTDLLVVGWSRGAAELLMSDAVLRDKKILWLVAPGHLYYLTKEMERVGRPKQFSLASCDDRAQLPFLLQGLPPCFSMAMVDHQLCPPNELMMLGQGRFTRTMAGLERGVHDLRHLLKRLPTLGQSIPLRAFRNAHAGRTALCIAAGPSLDRHLDFIREHMDRCVVIVVDVIQKRLQEAGIKIDFVMNVDSDDRLNERLVPHEDPKTTLIMPLMGHHQIDSKFQNRAFFAHGSMGQWLLGAGCIFNTGTTVGISSVGFAAYLGCSDAVLIGHDLSYAPEAVYSSMVSGGDEHGQAVLEATKNMRRQVPGNAGTPVLTDYLFEIGIQDLGLMLRMMPTFTVYNLNINHRFGAVISHTVALPDDWTPRGEGPLVRETSTQRLADSMDFDPLERFRFVMSGQLKDFLKGWRTFHQQGVPALTIEHTLFHHPATTLAHALIRYHLPGAMLLGMRLLSLPPSIGTTWQKNQLADYMDRLLVAVVDYWHQVLDPDFDKPFLGRLVVPDWNDTNRQFFMAVYSSAQMDLTIPAEALLIPIIGRGQRDIRDSLPEVDMPPPHSGHEGLMVIKHMGERVSIRYIVQTLCLCTLEGFYTPLVWARETGIVDKALIPSVDQPGNSAWPEVQATNAVLRIRQKSSKSLKADASAALRWPPTSLHLVRALIAYGETGIEQLRKLIVRRDLILDDQMIAQVLINVADFPMACALVRADSANIGEASMIAMARRHFEQAELDRAYGIAAAIRPLSRFRDQALSLQAEIHLRRGEREQAKALVAQLGDPDLVAYWSFDVSGLLGGHRDVIAAIQRQNAPPTPVMLGRLITEAWKVRDRESLETVMRMLFHFAHAPNVDTAQYFELSKGLNTMLASLGSDVSAIMRDEEEVQQGLSNLMSGGFGV